ncbi:hypothetical protein [Pseudomonas sp. XWY-1]|uniref:hypothetical protein n=1 Tax=Pseudomonas sp. XWY-1 TaxID=2069256 RepID=UPI000CF4EE19|nr:hypothetical protein [Pseudomonas sp. XWY-1]
MTRKILAFFLVASTTAFISGCGDHGQQKFDHIKSSALQMNTPFDAYSFLMREKIRLWTACNGICSEERYTVLKSADGELLDLYRKALDEADPRAYYELYVAHDLALNAGYDWEETDILRQAYASKLISFATSASTTPINANLLLAAGIVLSEGMIVQRDYSESMTFLYRAWKAGSSSAAKIASKTAEENKQPIDAYLWGLRCVGSCSSYSGRLDTLARGLDGNVILKAQQAAADDSIRTISDIL